MDILGDVSGIRTTRLQELNKLLAIRTNRFELIDQDLAQGLANFSTEWNREIAIFLTHSGFIVGTAIGKYSSVQLPPLRGRLSPGQIRCIHTHPSGSPSLSSLDYSALATLGLESMAALGVVGGKITGIQIAYNTESLTVVNLNFCDLAQFDYSSYLERKQLNPVKQSVNEKLPAEKAFLVGVTNQSDNFSLNELIELTRSANVEVVGHLVQPQRPRRNTYLGTGKLEELRQHVQETKANVVICDDELSPAQRDSLEKAAGIKVLDRTGLILDIFAQRARSREGKLQVELAQLRHLLPYLTGQGQALSRLGGGVGTRGPGETKLEMDRRRVRQRLNFLERELAKVAQNRHIQRQQRHKSGVPLITLVGYTNAGKTTFMQLALEQTGASANQVQGENKLFATLDPVIRRVEIDAHTTYLLSDTVGFIQKLPHQLLKAFLSTLEEVRQADCLLHILDASDPRALLQAETVNEVLHQLGCSDKPLVTVVNKTDRVENASDIDRIAQQLANPIAVSLIRGDSLTPVWAKIRQVLIENIQN